MITIAVIIISLASYYYGRKSNQGSGYVDGFHAGYEEQFRRHWQNHKDHTEGCS